MRTGDTGIAEFAHFFLFQGAVKSPVRPSVRESATPGKAIRPIVTRVILKDGKVRPLIATGITRFTRRFGPNDNRDRSMPNPLLFGRNAAVRSRAGSGAGRSGNGQRHNTRSLGSARSGGRRPDRE